MEGTLPFPKALRRRMQLLKVHKDHVNKLIDVLKEYITPSFIKNKGFFQDHADHVYIISGGFKDFIFPVVKDFGIKESHVIANTFLFDKSGNIVGFDKKNPLATKAGKTKAIKKLQLTGTVIMIGDGYTDYLPKKEKAVTHFFAFTENVYRDTVAKKADKIVKNFDEVLESVGLAKTLSFPKKNIKVLLLENIHLKALNMLQNEGYTVTALPHSLSEEELKEKVKDITILGVRSRAFITKNVLEKAGKMLAVGTFSIGTNHIDLSSAAQKGIAVFNAPYSSARSVVELALGEILLLARRAFEKSSRLHEGKWEKSAKDAHEIRGKKLGIIGYGNIGSQLSVLAEMLGMEVYFYDIVEKPALGNAKKCASLEELLRTCDIVSLHVDGKKSNTNLIGDEEFKLMKDGSIFINLSRGFVVNVDSLAKYIKSGKIIGAAVDVFPKEPKGNAELFTSPLQNLPNVILTPHIGGSTEEAQKAIGEFVAQRLITFINTGSTMLSVNFPNLSLPNQEKVHRLIHIHKNIPGILASINKVLADNLLNIEGQYLKTNEEIGYVITDVNITYNKKILEELKNIPGTIRVRILY